MRRLERHEDSLRREKRNKIIVGSMIIFLLLFSTVGYALFSGGSGVGHGGAVDSGNDLTEGPIWNGDQWVHVVNGRNFGITNSQEEIEDIEVAIDKDISYYSGKKVYFDVKDEDILREVASAINQYSSGIQRACLGECEEDLPEKSCNDDIIVWRESEENRVYEQNNCVFIEGDLKAADAFLYELLGISN